ncbi:hypothetical protein SEES7308_20623 [Salmonella enterica subsp. enterica serovar Stanley str. ATCC 7308]|nr:hypothetical protein SEES7308_20623 [Salmonella enterica subsp. enterica serovar Stanley str. ATCC 7308]
MLSDVLCGTGLIVVQPLKAGSVPLTAETGKPDTGFFVGSAAGGGEDTCFESHAQDVANQGEILINSVVPLILQPPFAVPGAGLLAG